MDFSIKTERPGHVERTKKEAIPSRLQDFCGWRDGGSRAVVLFQVVDDGGRARQGVEVAALGAAEAALAHVRQVVVQRRETGARLDGDAQPVAHALERRVGVAGEHGRILQHPSGRHHS